MEHLASLALAWDSLLASLPPGSAVTSARLRCAPGPLQHLVGDFASSRSAFLSLHSLHPHHSATILLTTSHLGVESSHELSVSLPPPSPSTQSPSED